MLFRSVPIDILFGSRSATHYTFERFKLELQQMYDLAREHMSLRQAKAASYVDRKKLNTVLQPNDHVLVFDHKSSKDKLGLRWKGPYSIVRCSHPCYQIQALKGLQWLPRDRLRKVPPDFATVEDEEEQNGSDNAQESSDDDENSDDNKPEGDIADNVRQNNRYSLRPRPQQRIPFY